MSDHCKFTIQWSLSNVDTVRTKIIVLISEVSFFQREKNMYLHKDGLKQVSWLRMCPLRLLYINHVSTINHAWPFVLAVERDFSIWDQNGITVNFNESMMLRSMATIFVPWPCKSRDQKLWKDQVIKHNFPPITNLDPARQHHKTTPLWIYPHFPALPKIQNVIAWIQG